MSLGGDLPGGVCIRRTAADCVPGERFVPNTDGQGGVCIACAGNQAGACISAVASSASASAAPTDGDDDEMNMVYLAPLALVGIMSFPHLYPSYSTQREFQFHGPPGDIAWGMKMGAEFEREKFHSFVRISHFQSGYETSIMSGTSYDGELIDASYASIESKDELAYEIDVRSEAEFGLWKISPAASAEFNYRREDEDWNSESTAGLTAAWTSHRWNVRARSSFIGTGAHELDLELQF